jgi:hypothetical protein
VLSSVVALTFEKNLKYGADGVSVVFWVLGSRYRRHESANEAARIDGNVTVEENTVLLLQRASTFLVATCAESGSELTLERYLP